MSVTYPCRLTVPYVIAYGALEHESKKRQRYRARFLTMLLAALAAGCSDPSLHPHADGDAQRGKALLQQYGCGACHRIPGVTDARGSSGPPLDRLGRRVFVAGVLANSPSELARWIRAPEAIKPGTGMPNAHVTEQDARDMVAYLYRLR
jgi:cytochrome c